jgi:5-carboxymethyl-2-hydroxymuconate isomerase
MHTMTARMLARRSVERKQDETDDLVEVITDVVSEIFDELLLAALKQPDVRTAITNLVSAGRRASSGRAPVRAAEVKAARRR